jgi:hypothetical protein
MLDTFATIEVVGPVRVNEPFILRGLTTLPVRWTVHSSASGSNS